MACAEPAPAGTSPTSRHFQRPRFTDPTLVLARISTGNPAVSYDLGESLGSQPSRTPEVPCQFPPIRRIEMRTTGSLLPTSGIPPWQGIEMS